MTFGEIQAAVLERFEETDRANAKLWINLFGAELYESEEWGFRGKTYAPTITAGAFSSGAEPTDFGPVVDVWNSRGEPLEALEWKQFYRTYQPMFSLVQTGVPEAYSAFDGQLYIGPASSETATYTANYLARWVALSDDGDTPDLPTNYHWLLVSGAMAIGQGHTQDPTAAMLDPTVARGLEALRREYLSDVYAVAEQWGKC